MTHTYSVESVAVAGGELAVGVWQPEGDITATIVAIHGITASHRAWAALVPRLPNVRIVAPDLRGRGRSNEVAGAAGMAAHAADMIAVLDHFGLEKSVLVGHSMGAFVSAVAAYQYPERIERVVLVDGGMPLDVPAGLDPDALVARILGATAARLDMRFASVDDYFDLWRKHPAFADDWTDELEDYLAYDLVPAGDGMLRPSTSYQVVVEDTVSLNTTDLPREAVENVTVPAVFVWVPRGLQNETPGLYPPAQVERIEAALPDLRVRYIDDLNHYTVVMSDRGAASLALIIMGELGDAAER